MITLFRKIRLWQLRTKWQLAIWQFINTQLTEILADSENTKSTQNKKEGDAIGK